MIRRTAGVLTASLATLLLVGCGAGVPAATTTPTAAPATTAAVAPTPEPPAEPTADDQAPPTVELVVADGTAVAGNVGSWCYGNTCADIVIGPADRQPRLDLAAPGEELEARLASSAATFNYWRASYRAAADEDDAFVALAEGGMPAPDPDAAPTTDQSLLSELTAATFGGPPSGEWLLELRLEFATGGGAAPYYWYAVVP